MVGINEREYTVETLLESLNILFSINLDEDKTHKIFIDRRVKPVGGENE